RDVADVLRKAVRRIERVETAHQPVARHLRDDRRRRDRGTLLVAVDNGHVLGRSRAETEAVDETGVRGGERLEHRPEPCEVRVVEAVSVDVRRRDDAYGYAFRARDDSVEQLLAAIVRALLRVVEEGERPDAVLAERAVVEQNAGNDERACERSASSLVRAC